MGKPVCPLYVLSALIYMSTEPQLTIPTPSVPPEALEPSRPIGAPVTEGAPVTQPSQPEGMVGQTEFPKPVTVAFFRRRLCNC